MRSILILLLITIGPVCSLAADETHQLRVVTLAPALTQMVIDFGLQDSIVGLSENDMTAVGLVDNVPVVGNYLQVNIEALITTRPTHVVMMTGKAGLPDNLKHLSTAQGFELVGYNYPTTLNELAEIIATDPNREGQADDTPSMGEILGVQDIALKVRRRMLRQLQAIRDVTAGRERPRVLMIIYTNPLMASGPGSVNDQLLACVGAINAAGDAVTSAPTYDREKLLAVNPDVVLLISPNGAPLQSVDADPRLALFRGLGIKAVRNGRIYLIDDSLAQLPTTTIPRIALAMGKAIHPDLADQIDQAIAVTMVAGQEESATQPNTGDHVE